MGRARPVRGGRRVRTLYVVGGFAFVPHPGCHGHWLRVDVAVVKVPCSACGSPVGLPCQGVDGYRAGTHYVRRDAAKLADYPDAREVRLTINRAQR